MKKIAITIVIAVAAVVAVGSPASAAPSRHRHVSDVRCLAQHAHPHSRAAKQCRKQGWIIRRHFVIAPDDRHWDDQSGYDINDPIDWTAPTDNSASGQGAYWWCGEPGVDQSDCPAGYPIYTATPDPVVTGDQPDFSGGCGICMGSGTTPVIPQP